jgi:hypothetical protein
MQSLLLSMLIKRVNASISNILNALQEHFLLKLGKGFQLTRQAAVINNRKTKVKQKN